MFAPIALDRTDQIDDIIETTMNPKTNGVFVFKHSTRCIVSSMVLKDLKKQWDLDESFTVLLLDLIKFRHISNELAAQFRVIHESPQLLYISGGEVRHHASHWEVNMETVHNWLDD